jgi:trans-aconitate methyltransferase
MKDAGPTSSEWNSTKASNRVFLEKFDVCVRTFHDWLSPVFKTDGAAILDFGCGDGVMALGMALQLNPANVVGIDLADDVPLLKRLAESEIGLQELPGNLQLCTMKVGEALSKRFRVDCIFSWSVFEHISQEYLDDVVADLRDTLNDGGYVFVQIAPLYYSAEGSHLFGLADRPWAHLTEQGNRLRATVRNAKPAPVPGQLLGDYDEAGFEQYRERAWSCYLTLNKLTADDLIDLFKRHGFELIREHRSDCRGEPSAYLKRVYDEKILRNEQIVALFRKPPTV